MSALGFAGGCAPSRSSRWPPGPRRAAEVGPGYFDLRALNIQVMPNDQLSFIVRHSESSVCDQGTGLCSPLYPSVSPPAHCSSDDECDPFVGIQESGDTYPSGSAIY